MVVASPLQGEEEGEGYAWRLQKALTLVLSPWLRGEAGASFNFSKLTSDQHYRPVAPTRFILK